MMSAITCSFLHSGLLCVFLVAPPMELAVFGLLLLFVVATASLVTVNRSEDQFSYPELRKQRAKFSHISSSPAQTPKTSLESKREFHPERIIEAEPTVARPIVGNAMGVAQVYCFQGQGLNVARIMMRENHLQSLPVLDVYKGFVGTITMRDIAAFEEQRRK
jgi:CBS domain